MYHGHRFAHPMVRDMDGRMGGFFDDALKKLSQSVSQSLQSGVDKFKTQAIAAGASSILKDERVQEALVESGKESMAQELANNILQTTNASVQYVKENKNTVLLVGGIAAALLVGVLIMRRR